MTAQQQTQASASTIYAQTGGAMAAMHVDAGLRSALADGLGRTWFSCDARGFVRRLDFDAGNRPVAGQVCLRGSATVVASMRTAYGESMGPQAAQAVNLCGRMSEHFDQGMWQLVNGRGIHGGDVARTSALVRLYQGTPDGMPAVDVPSLSGSKPGGGVLQAATYTATRQRLDALGRMQEEVNENGNVCHIAYLLSGAPETISVDGRSYCANVVRNAKAQIVSMNRASQGDDPDQPLLATAFRYDAKTLRAIQNYASTSAAFVASSADSGSAINGACDPGRRQDIRYAFDPNGNLLSVLDAYPAIVFDQDRNAFIRSDYSYDALERMLSATGMESADCSPIDGRPQASAAEGVLAPDSAGFAALRPWRQQYFYDDAGNTLAIFHVSNGVLDPARSMTMKVSSGSNRAIPESYYTSLGGQERGTTVDESFFVANGLFDSGGNAARNANLGALQWDFRNQATGISYPAPDASGAAVSENATYTEAGAARVRKVTATCDASGVMTKLETVAYLGDTELRMTYVQDDVSAGIDYDGDTVGNALVQTSFSEQRIRLGHAQYTRILDGVLAPGKSPTRCAWHSLTNHIDSCEGELGDDGNIANYQSFYPYGAISFAAADAGSAGGLASKQVQYSGQELDESRLVYYGFRYYDASSFRWMRPDPAGFAGSGLNWYCMLNGNPVSQRDLYGLGGPDQLARGRSPSFRALARLGRRHYHVRAGRMLQFAPPGYAAPKVHRGLGIGGFDDPAMQAEATKQEYAFWNLDLFHRGRHVLGLDDMYAIAAGEQLERSADASLYEESLSIMNHGHATPKYFNHAFAADIPTHAWERYRHALHLRDSQRSAGVHMIRGEDFVRALSLFMHELDIAHKFTTVHLHMCLSGFVAPEIMRALVRNGIAVRQLTAPLGTISVGYRRDSDDGSIKRGDRVTVGAPTGKLNKRLIVHTGRSISELASGSNDSSSPFMATVNYDSFRDTFQDSGLPPPSAFPSDADYRYYMGRIQQTKSKWDPNRASILYKRDE